MLCVMWVQQGGPLRGWGNRIFRRSVSCQAAAGQSPGTIRRPCWLSSRALVLSSLASEGQIRRVEPLSCQGPSQTRRWCQQIGLGDLPRARGLGLLCLGKLWALRRPGWVAGTLAGWQVSPYLVLLGVEVPRLLHFLGQGPSTHASVLSQLKLEDRSVVPRDVVRHMRSTVSPKSTKVGGRRDSLLRVDWALPPRLASPEFMGAGIYLGVRRGLLLADWALPPRIASVVPS